VVRVRELQGAATAVSLSSPMPVVSAEMLGLLEQPTSASVRLEGGRVRFTLPSHGVATVRLSLDLKE
jgi:hypothetical protein